MTKKSVAAPTIPNGKTHMNTVPIRQRPCQVISEMQEFDLKNAQDSRTIHVPYV
jgi:hypothetical protein